MGKKYYVQRGDKKEEFVNPYEVSLGKQILKAAGYTAAGIGATTACALVGLPAVTVGAVAAISAGISGPAIVGVFSEIIDKAKDKHNQKK